MRILLRIWFNLAIVLDFIALVLLLPFFCGRSVAVHDARLDRKDPSKCSQDIFLDEGKLILKTWGSHLVSKRSPLPIKIRLTDTSHYLLEDKSFCVKWRDPEELYLLNLKGATGFTALMQVSIGLWQWSFRLNSQNALEHGSK